MNNNHSLISRDALQDNILDRIDDLRRRMDLMERYAVLNTEIINEVLMAADGYGIINVRDYGAVGDGVTDDTAAIELAWADIKGDVGGIIYFPPGSYYCLDGLDFSASSPYYTPAYIIMGAGEGRSTILTHNAAVGIDLGGRNNVRIENIRLYDNGTTAAVGVARYRVDTGGDGTGSLHTYRNFTIEGNYSKACLYSIASEVNSHYSVKLINGGAGDCYYTAQTNGLSATTAQTILTGSNTVNNFYGGEMVNGGSGATLHCVDDVTDNLNFYSTYFASIGTGKNIWLVAPTDGSVQGRKLFDGCRFEGVVDTFTLTGLTVNELSIEYCEFGQNPGLDINYTNTSTGAGLQNAYINNNIHLDKGITIPAIEGSYIRIPTNSNYHGTTFTINHHIATSYIESDPLTLGGSCYVYASVLVENDGSAGTHRVKYGPHTATGAGNAQGAVIVNKPFGSAPTGALSGTLAHADGNNWTPVGAITNVPRNYMVFYDGTNWKPLSTPWRVEFADAAPASGTYAVGDRVYNTIPAATEYDGWVCITAGSPGTWKGFGAIEA